MSVLLSLGTNTLHLNQLETRDLIDFLSFQITSQEWFRAWKEKYFLLPSQPGADTKQREHGVFC